MRISRPLNLLRLASVLATAQLLLAVAILGSHGTPGALGGDFIAYYGAGKQALAGDWQQLYALPAQLIFQQPLLRSSGLAAGGPAMIPFDYPPPAALLFLPLAALPAGAATLLWLALNAAMALVAWRVMFRPDGPPLLAIFLLLPLDWGLLSGQPVGIMLLFAALAFRSLLRRQDLYAGIWLGAIAVIKPQLLVVPLLGLLVLRRPRAVLGMALAGAALLATSLVLVGVPGLVTYLQLLRRIDPALGNAALSVRTGAMINWRAWITALPGISSNAALALTAAAAVVTVAAALIGGRRRVGDVAFTWHYLGLNAAGLLAGYHSHYQDLVMLMPPAAMLLPLAFLVRPAQHPPINGRATLTKPAKAGWEGNDGLSRLSPLSRGFVRVARPLMILLANSVARQQTNRAYAPLRSARYSPYAGRRDCHECHTIAPNRARRGVLHTPWHGARTIAPSSLTASGIGGRAPSIARLADLAVPLTALLLVGAPGLAWLLFGLFALSWLPIWTALAVAGLLLLLVAGRRQGDVSQASAIRPGADDLSIIARGTAEPAAAPAAAVPVSAQR
ncbi:MAG TPA: glycosyltransferase 87 family protein [Chloroflexota bacterium]|nr:glycosyltransferase 87 family protein [Chloroflexota bacterium]